MRIPSQTEREQCLNKADTSYEDYKRETSEAKP